MGVYSPCEGSNTDHLDAFYEQLVDVVNKRGSESLILLGDRK